MKLVQITAIGDKLAALDDSGRLWVRAFDCWFLIEGPTDIGSAQIARSKDMASLAAIAATATPQ